MLRKQLVGLLTLGALISLNQPNSQALAFQNDKLPKALSFKPRQPDVNYDKVAPADIEKCDIATLS